MAGLGLGGGWRGQVASQGQGSQQEDEGRIPSTLSQLHDIANRPPADTQMSNVTSVWGSGLSQEGGTPAVPASIRAAASSNDVPAPMGVVKTVRVPDRHQIETLTPKEHYEVATSVPFVKPAEIAAALIAAKMLTTQEWANQACHYVYDNNFVHYIGVPEAKRRFFDEAEENGTEIIGSRSTAKNGVESFTMTISKPGLSSASGTLKNVPVTMSRDALYETLEMIEGVNVKSLTRDRKNPAQWSVRLQGPGIKDLHIIRLRNIIKNQPAAFVDALLLIPGRKIACKICTSTEHPFFFNCADPTVSG